MDPVTLDRLYAACFFVYLAVGLAVACLTAGRTMRPGGELAWCVLLWPLVLLFWWWGCD